DEFARLLQFCGLEMKAVDAGAFDGKVDVRIRLVGRKHPEKEAPHVRVPMDGRHGHAIPVLPGTQDQAFRLEYHRFACFGRWLPPFKQAAPEKPAFGGRLALTPPAVPPYCPPP